MADESDLSFGKLAIEKGFISPKQLEEAAEILRAVRKLGLKESIGSVLVKKKFLTTAQAKEIRQYQGKRSGYKIGGYEIMEKVGQGGMGVVFKARQLSLDRIVALKILNPKLSADKAFTERFKREARAVAKLSHPNIIVGIDVGQEGKYFYFAMEYVEGRTGLEILRDEKRFTEKDVLKIAHQMAKALEHADKNNLVHRDIKPDNIMVTQKGEAKLCDLGLAKRLDTGDTLQPGTAVGTPHYIAPEQARGREDVDIRADIYALGASLYHMTTGRTLFHGETAASIMTHHLSSEAPNAKKVRPELSEHFCRLLERMLAKNPEDRYQKPADLLQDLDRLMAGKPIKGSLKADVPCSMERTVRRARAPGQFSSRGTTGPRTPVGPPDPTTGPRQPVAAPRPTGMILAGAGVGALVLVVIGLLFFNSSDPQPDNKPDNTKTGTAKPGTKGQQTTVASKVTTPKAKPRWEPLEAARKARKTSPTEHLRLVSLYERAEKGAPAALLRDIRREKKEVEDQLNSAIQKKVNAQWEKAYRLMADRDFAGAMACFALDTIPLEIRCPSAESHWKKKQVDLEQQVFLKFHRDLEPELIQAMTEAGDDVDKLESIRPKLASAKAQVPLPHVAKRVAELEAQLEKRIKKVAVTKRRAQFDAFQQTLTKAKGLAGKSGTKGLSDAALELRSQRPLLAEQFRPIADQFAKDLHAVTTIYQKAWKVLGDKGEKRETIKLYYPAGAAERQEFKLAGKVRGSEGGVWSTKQGAETKLSFSELDDRDVLKFAELYDTDDAGKKTLGVFHFWRGQPGRAYELLQPFKEDKSFGLYIFWMDLQAKELIAQVDELYREVTTLRLSSIEKEKRRRIAAKLIQELKAGYSATEVYRERTKP